MNMCIRRLVIYYLSFGIGSVIQFVHAKDAMSQSTSIDNSSQSNAQALQSNISYIQQISNNPLIYAKNVANKITQNINKSLLDNNQSISSNKSTLKSIQEKIQTEVTNLADSISKNNESISKVFNDKISDIISTVSSNQNTNITDTNIGESISNIEENIVGNVVSEEFEEGGSFLDTVKEKITSVTDKLKNSIGENISNLINSSSAKDGISNITNTIINIVNESINNGVSGSLINTASQITLNSGIQENIKEIVSEKLNLLEQMGVSDETISKLNENISSIIDGPMKKLTEGDFSGAASSLSETVSKIKNTIADNVTNIIEEKKEVLQDTIIEKLGGEDSTLGELASDLITNINDDVNITKIADQALSGDFTGAFDSIKESIGNLKETFSFSNLKDKASNWLSSFFSGKQNTIKDTVTSVGSTIKSAIGNSTLGSTTIGKALLNVVDNAVENVNENAISAVNDILSSSTDDERAMAIEKLKNVGLDFNNTNISSALTTLSHYQESITKSSSGEDSLGGEGGKDSRESDSSPLSVSDSEKNIDEYVNKIQSEPENTEKEVYHSEVEESSNIEHEYLNHEGNNVATAHYESSIHGAKTNSNSSDNN